jgi:hypothetical protein
LLLVAMLACHAASAKTVRIGLLPDLDGPYADISGKGVIEAARMAIEDTKDRLPGWQVDVASAIVQRWFDEDKCGRRRRGPELGDRIGLAEARDRSAQAAIHHRRGFVRSDR